jgi:hypothetical protein
MASTSDARDTTLSQESTQVPEVTPGCVPPFNSPVVKAVTLSRIPSLSAIVPKLNAVQVAQNTEDRSNSSDKVFEPAKACDSGISVMGPHKAAPSEGAPNSC